MSRETKYVLKWVDKNKGYVGVMCGFVNMSEAVQYDTIGDIRQAQTRIKNRFNSETKIFELIMTLGEEINEDTM